MYFLSNEEEEEKNWHDGCVRYDSLCSAVCERSVLIPMLFYPFFLAAGSDVKNKDLSVYEFHLYEYLLSSLDLHY